MSDYTKTQVLGIVWELLTQARDELIRNFKKEIYWLQHRYLSIDTPFYLPAGIPNPHTLFDDSPLNRLNRQVLTQAHRQIVHILKTPFGWQGFLPTYWYGPGL